MEPRELALSQARGRIAVGTGLVLLPGLAGRMWIGDDATRSAVKVFTRALGARDLAIGLGVVLALDRGAPVRGWLEAGVLADAVDFAGTLLAGGAIPAGARRAAMAVAGGSALAGAALARALDEPRS
jgi:hypothetical protein